MTNQTSLITMPAKRQAFSVLDWRADFLKDLLATWHQETKSWMEELTFYSTLLKYGRIFDHQRSTTKEWRERMLLYSEVELPQLLKAIKRCETKFSDFSATLEGSEREELDLLSRRYRTIQKAFLEMKRTLIPQILQSYPVKIY